MKRDEAVIVGAFVMSRFVEYTGSKEECMAMMRRGTVNRIFEVATLLVVSVFFWSAYSLIRFDGFFHPIYTFGLSDPYEYYQQHIGSRLVLEGDEYGLQGIDTSGWYIYHDPQNKFEFKHPYAQIEDIRYQDLGTRRLQLESGMYSYDNCEIYLEFNARGVGTRWLPRKRHSIEFSIQNDRESELHFIRDQYGGAIQIRSARLDGVEQGDIRYTGATFIRNGEDMFVHIVDHGNTCNETVMQGMLATFRFVE